MLKTTKNKIIVLAAVFLTALIVGIVARISRSDGQSIIDNEQLTITESTETTASETTATTTTAATTAKPKAESKNETAETTEPAETTAEDITLAPVDIPEQEVIDILEENDIEITTTTPKPQTTPATEPNGPKPGDTKTENGQKYVWHPDFGWCPDYGEGTVVVMDVEDKGDREPYEGGW